jgi:hypothetical protein
MLFISETTRERMSSIPDDMLFVDSFDIRGRVNKMAVYSLPDPDHATVGKPADPPPAEPPPADARVEPAPDPA